MSALLIWTSPNEAKLFHVDANSIHVEKIVYKSSLHPSEVSGRIASFDQFAELEFFKILVEKLKSVGSEKWLLMGPDQTPVRFKQYLVDHCSEMFQKLIGLEKVDQMPDSEILSVGRMHLQRYYLFHST